MGMHAHVADGIVREVLDDDVGGVPLADRYHPDFVAALIPIPEGVTVAQGDTWDGQTFAPPVPEPDPVPVSVSRLQLVRALREAGLKEAFDMALAGASADAQEDWSLAVEIRRDDPMVTAFSSVLEVSTAATDDLFRRAAAL